MKNTIQQINELLQPIELKYSIPIVSTGSTTISMMKNRLESLTPILENYNAEAKKAINDFLNENDIDITDDLKEQIKIEGTNSARRITRVITGMQ